MVEYFLLCHKHKIEMVCYFLKNIIKLQISNLQIKNVEIFLLIRIIDKNVIHHSNFEKH